MRGRCGFKLLLIFCILLILVPAMTFAVPIIDFPAWFERTIPSGLNISSIIGSDHVTGPIEAHSNGAMILDKDLIINKGQVVSFDNFDIEVDCKSDGEHKIVVMDGGILSVNNSSISSLDGEHAYAFMVEKGGLLHMSGSKLTNCGYDSPDSRFGGLWLAANGISVENSDISGGHYGIIIDGGDVSIINNTINSNYCGVRANSQGILTIINNTINDNSHNGLYVTGTGGLKTVVGNNIEYNGDGILLDNVSKAVVTDNRVDNNEGYGIRMDNANADIVNNNNISLNRYGLYLYSSDNNIYNGNVVCNNANDGIFINASSNSLFEGNTVYNNNGFGFNVSGNDPNTMIDKKTNTVSGNVIGDFNVPSNMLSIEQISLLSLLMAFSDKLIYLINFPKFIITNLFSGISNPLREPTSNLLDRIFPPSRRRGYRNAHVSSHMNVLYFHVINGRDIRGIVHTETPGSLFSHEIVLQQIRFFDVLIRDRVMLFRNVLYMAIMTGIGIIVYTVQVSVGTYLLPYLLPLAIQFVIMFPIGLLVQNNIVGRVEKLDYDIRDEATIDMLREDAHKKIVSLEGRYKRNKLSAAKYQAAMNKLNEALETIDRMDIRRYYLLFTPAGFRKAISGYARLLEKSPEDPLLLAGIAEAYAMLGHSLEMNGEDGKQYYPAAESAAQSAYALNSGRYEVRRAYARSLYFAGNIEDAEKEATIAIKLHSGDAESYQLLAAMKDDPAEKLKLLHKAVSINKNLIIARRELGIAYLEAGEPDKALSQFNAIIKLEPTDPYAHFYIGRIYGLKEKPAEAADEYRKALELYPGYKEALGSLAKATIIIKS